MLNLTVTEDEQGAGMQQLPVDEILFLQSNANDFIDVHTKNKQYYVVGSLKFWESAFEQTDLNFLRLDRGVLTNMDKIRCLNTSLKVAYFDYPLKRDTKYCTISYGRYRTILKKLPPELPKIETALL
ncbi:LytTR family transcriptional regulator DNA-binding domain-containing protein [Paenibacillus rhizophilus]|uniref:HTH LytTR-type domain-containing protein n=1 Tax=Paenibacillus rhizophilus TaxID=1850366 RepID=A0A3N9P8S2_9BACL|nr:LytTR family transcriptional regulator DNA-binding domain-containing protein [Paenibacillus rhizophilus]RQW11880.1 hypothetical protein EH198_09405 [Paenibacillus rhizophilus]